MAYDPNTDKMLRGGGFCCFPVKIAPGAKGGGWSKTPLVRFTHLGGRPYEGDRWARANAAGVLMGDGLYTLDLDEQKPHYLGDRWLEQWKVPMHTLQHRTMSGGRHLIFRTPPGYLNLPNRANIVPGLDGRGHHGFIVWAGGADGRSYEAINDLPMAMLPAAVCAEIERGYKPPTGPDAVAEFWSYQGAEWEANTLKKLEWALGRDRTSDFTQLWEHGGKDHDDTSRSGRDFSMACMLALRGFDHDEIGMLLENHFHWGQGDHRSASRCAAKATARHSFKIDRLIKFLRKKEPQT